MAPARRGSECDRLASTAIEKALGDPLDVLYERFVRLGDSLMDTRGEHVARVGEVADSFGEIDHFLDDRRQHGIERDSFDGMAKHL